MTGVCGTKKDWLLHDGALRLVLILDIAVIAIATAWTLQHPESPRTAFEEWGIVTAISFLQLVLISAGTFRIYRTRKDQLRGRSNTHQYVIWFIIAVGFFYLALDEGLEFHEQMDREIHNILGIEESGLTDRIDDMIVWGI